MVLWQVTQEGSPANIGVRIKHCVPVKCIEQHGHGAQGKPFLSPPVLMHGGLLCITFRLSVSLSACLLSLGATLCTSKSESHWQVCPLQCQVAFLLFYSSVKVKGHMGQGQRSHWPRSNKGPEERQVGSHQRQVASF